MRRRWLIGALIVATFPVGPGAHETRPGFLELRQTAADTYAFLWKKPAGGEIEIYIAPLVPADCVLATSGNQALTPGALVVRGSLRCPDGIHGLVEREVAVDGENGRALAGRWVR